MALDRITFENAAKRTAATGSLADGEFPFRAAKAWAIRGGKRGNRWVVDGKSLKRRAVFDQDGDASSDLGYPL